MIVDRRVKEWYISYFFSFSSSPTNGNAMVYDKYGLVSAWVAGALFDSQSQHIRFIQICIYSKMKC